MSSDRRRYTWSCPRCGWRPAKDRQSRRAIEVEVGPAHLSRRHGKWVTRVTALEVKPTDANAAAEMAARVRVGLEEGIGEAVHAGRRTAERVKVVDDGGKEHALAPDHDDLAPRATVDHFDLLWRERVRREAFYG